MNPLHLQKQEVASSTAATVYSANSGCECDTAAFLQILMLGNTREAKVVPRVTQVVTEKSMGESVSTCVKPCVPAWRI